MRLIDIKTGEQWTEVPVSPGWQFTNGKISVMRHKLNNCVIADRAWSPVDFSPMQKPVDKSEYCLKVKIALWAQMIIKRLLQNGEISRDWAL